jgi:hypothetical protein
VSVLGIERGLTFIERQAGVSVLIVMNGHIVESSGFPKP